MKVIDAIWEKRNLGVSAIEIIIENNDITDDVIKTVEKLSAQYIVAKVDSTRTDILLKLQQSGFSFIESMIETEISLKASPVLPGIYQRFLTKTNIREASNREIEYVIDSVHNGLMFNTDRIALDPWFSVELSAQRYAYWIADMMKNSDNYMQVTCYNDKIIGFNVVSDKTDYYDGMLGGLLPDFINSGLGILNFYGGLIFVYEKKAKKFRAHVSTNNIKMLKLHLMAGMNVNNCEYCLIKHQ